MSASLMSSTRSCAGLRRRAIERLCGAVASGAFRVQLPEAKLARVLAGAAAGGSVDKGARGCVFG